MIIRYLILFACFGIASLNNISFANYVDFAKEIRVAENDFIESRYDESLEKYTLTLQKYGYPYLKETMQAAFVACYARKKESFTELMTEALNLGLTKSEFDFLITKWNALNKEQTVFIDFEKHRTDYIGKINWEKTTSYLKLDAYRSHITKTYSLTESNHDEYYKHMNLLRDRYIELVQQYGYVNDRDSGRRFKIKVKTGKKKKNRATTVYLDLDKDDFLLEHFRSQYLKVDYESKTTIWSSSDPGAWFLTHYINSQDINSVDSVYFDLMLDGLNQLKVSPYLLVNMLESTRVIENDFALTYYSRVWLGLKMSYSDKYKLADPERQRINSNRQKHGLRTLEEEEKLLRHLYFLTQNKELPSDFSNDMLNEISFENRIFIQIMV